MSTCLPGADLELFGSLATGLPLPDSDIDLVAVSLPPEKTAGLQDGGRLPPRGRTALRLVASALRACDWIIDVRSIETASVPVIKFKVCSNCIFVCCGRERCYDFCTAFEIVSSLHWLPCHFVGICCNDAEIAADALAGGIRSLTFGT